MVFVSFAGTESQFGDWFTDLANGTTGHSLQYAEAIRLMKGLIEQYGSENLHLVGHSLGGGLASASALFFDLPASTFNAAGVHPIAIAGGKKGLRDDSRITSYVVCGEALNSLQSAIPFLMPDSRGRRIDLAQNNKYPTELHKMVPLIEQIELELRMARKRLQQLSSKESR